MIKHVSIKCVCAAMRQMKIWLERKSETASVLYSLLIANSVGYFNAFHPGSTIPIQALLALGPVINQK